MLGFAHISDRQFYDKLREFRLDNGLPFFDQAWDLNLFMVRDDIIGEWTDEAIIITHDNAGRPVVHRCIMTGDASESEWTDPTHPNGCLWVLPGHYAGGYHRGLHKGRKCFRQRRDFNNVRWPKSMGRVPTASELIERGKVHGFMDIRGTNWHNRFSGQAPVKPKPGDSEGCPVNLYYHQHEGAIMLGDLQQKYRGSSIVSPTFLQITDIT